MHRGMLHDCVRVASGSKQVVDHLRYTVCYANSTARCSVLSNILLCRVDERQYAYTLAHLGVQPVVVSAYVYGYG